MKMNTLVEKVLREYPETRSNDRLLMIKVWELQGFYLSESQRDKFLHISSTETVRRIRQKIQEQGLYPALDKVKAIRRFKGYQMQQMMPSLKTDKVQQTMEAVPTIGKRWQRQRFEFGDV